MNAYLADWPLIEQVAELTRTVIIRKTGETSQEVVYLMTALTPLEASPQRLLELVRGHWSIENSSHYVRDVTFHEDRSRLRSGHAPQIMAALRNLVITLFHRQGTSQIAATRRHFASHPSHAFALLLPTKRANLQKGRSAIIHKPWDLTIAGYLRRSVAWQPFTGNRAGMSKRSPI
jgi:predicted transposase YbfD/YdcC